MSLCHLVLDPVVQFVRVLIGVVTTWVERVCEWVSRVITVIKRVVERVCRWLPWPVNKLCDLVTRIIEVVETVWDWVCREIVHRIIRWVEAVVSYIVWVARLVCFVIDLPRRIISVLACLLGLRGPRRVEVCAVVLPREDGTPVATFEQVLSDVEEANEVLAQCDIQLELLDVHLSRSREWAAGATCGPGALLEGSFTWFSSHTCGCCGVVTLFYVDSIADKIGCAYPAEDWLLISDGGGLTIAHEIGHLAALTHHDERTNVMFENVGGTQFTRYQCCVLASAPFATVTASLPERRDVERSRERLQEHLRRLEGRPWHGLKGTQVKVDPEQAVAALTAAALVVLGVRRLLQAGRR